MKKLCFAIMILAGVSVVSCSSGDDEHTPSWFVDKNLAKADIADHYYADGKIYIHMTANGSCMQVWRKDNSGGLGSNDFTIDGDSIRFTARNIAFRAHLVKYGELEPLSLVLSGDFKDSDFLPGGLKPGIYKQVK